MSTSLTAVVDEVANVDVDNGEEREEIMDKVVEDLEEFGQLE
jgi:hypothetical protein